MAYGVILKHLEVDKITWGSFPHPKNFFKRGTDCLFGGKEGRGALILTGVENNCPKNCLKKLFSIFF
jgi:hypothetical protein